MNSLDLIEEIMQCIDRLWYGCPLGDDLDTLRDNIQIIKKELIKQAKIMTNGDRIRNMTDEELAAFMDIYTFEDICRTRCLKPAGDRTICHGEECVSNILKWLKQEVNNDER